jgi:WD40 repeat protein
MLRLQGHKQSVRCLAYSADGQLLASGGADHTVKLWEWATGKLVASLKGHEGFVTAVAFSPDGKTLASGGGHPFGKPNYVRFWEVPSGKALAPLAWRDGGLIACLCYHPSGQALAASSRWAGGGGSITGGGAGYWSLGPKPRWNRFGFKEVYALTLSPDGQELAVAVGRPGSGRKSTRDSGVYVRPWSGTRKVFLPHRSRVWSVAFASGSKRLASAMGKEVHLWDLSAPDRPVVLEGHEREVRSEVFAPDGDLLASGSLDGIIILWDVEARRQRSRFDGELGQVYAIAFAPDGMTMAVAGDLGIAVFDVDRE